jgi:uncharacterized protein (DUF924 family)
MNLHEFWFGNIEITPEYYEKQLVRWFYGLDKKFDEDCKLFINTTTNDPLTQILIWDQLPRNVYRGSAKAFETDHHAQKLALSLIDTDYEKQLTLPERIFLYMPLEHAEDLNLQELSVEKFYSLHIEAPDEIKPWTQLGLTKAIEHMKTIREFGLFPKRVRNDAIYNALAHPQNA